MSVKTADIRKGMLDRWGGQEWAIMWEVAPATGAVAKARYADAVMMSLWPSRGLELHGVEIKVSRSDWRREAKDPTKAEAVAAYCDRWWLHVAPGVILDLSEVPPAWGVREFDGKAWKTLREAARTEAKPVGREFLAALLRRADGPLRAAAKRDADEAVAAARAAVSDERQKIDERVKAEVERRSGRYQQLAETVSAFEAGAGISLTRFMTDVRAKEIGALVGAVHRLGFGRGLGAVQDAAARLRLLADEAEAALAASGLVGEP